MSAVKNLRAMFEQKQDASPPDRGRSPGLSSNGTEPPPPPARPLSKIRTSFVAVEKDGRVGLRRDPSNESSLSQRRLSSHTEGEASVSGQSDKTMATEETSGGFKASVVSETIPESPRRPDATKGSPQAATRSLGAVTDKPSHNPDKHARSKTPTRSPTTTKAPALPQSGSKLSAPKAAHDPAKKTPEKPATSTPKTGAKTAGSNKKPAPVNVTPPSGAGFVKPKVKSPTRPVRLPASLMAPTAASVSKVKGEAPRETLSRSSGNQGRPASRASAAGAGPHKTLKRQNSVINRPRPSIKPRQDHPSTKKEKEVDENFLARMMRPTQSSSSKTTEKAPVTPPRHRSSTQGSGKASSVSRSPRRTIKRSPESVRTGSPFTKRETSIEEVAAETAQVETVEKVAEVVDKAEEPVEVKPEPEPVKAPVTPEPIPEESSSDKTSDPEPSAAVTSGSDGVNEDRPESPEFDELTQRAARLSIDEGDTHELKSPDEFEELLEETVEEQNEAPASSVATTEVKTETA
uniref:Mucin-7 n=1 Tax=Colletotrichum fructicola (strain Nara gc5) TaxID=1213859 RepID=L2FJ88_COLFN